MILTTAAELLRYNYCAVDRNGVNYSGSLRYNYFSRPLRNAYFSRLLRNNYCSRLLQ